MTKLLQMFLTAALRAALGLDQLPSLDFAAAATETTTEEQEEAADTVNA